MPSIARGTDGSNPSPSSGESHAKLPRQPYRRCLDASYRDVEELLAERGLDISYETVRRWVLKFGPAIARRLRQRRPRPSDRWHLDAMVVRIAGERMYLWRAVDHEGEVLDMLVQRRRDGRAALRLMRKLLKKQGFVPKLLVTDGVSRRPAQPGPTSSRPTPLSPTSTSSRSAPTSECAISGWRPQPARPSASPVSPDPIS